MLKTNALLFETQQTAPVPEEDEIIEVNGFIGPRSVIEKTIRYLLDQHVQIVGEPGMGKTFFAENILPPLLNEAMQTTYSVHYILLSNYKDERNLLEHIEVTIEGNTQFAASNVVKAWEKATAVDQPVLVIFDEANRVDGKRQTILTPLLERKPRVVLALQNKLLQLHPLSRMVLLSNPTGGGTFKLNENLADRLKVIDWPPPPARVMARMLMADDSRRSGRKVIRTREWTFYDNLLSEDEVLALCQAIKRLDVYRKSPVSIREMQGYYFELKRNRLTDALKQIRHDIRAKVDVSNPAAAREINATFSRLMETIKDNMACMMQTQL